MTQIVMKYQVLVAVTIALLTYSCEAGHAQPLLSWRQAAPPNPRAYLAAASAGGKIFIFGGYRSGDVHLATTDVYDPATDEWSELNTQGQITPRALFAATAVDGKVYAIGGMDISADTSSLVLESDVFDPNTNSWSPLVASGEFEPRAGQCMAAIGEKIYVIGGIIDINSSGYHPPANYVQVLDLATNNWSTLACTGVWKSREGATASVIDGKIYITGGDSSRIVPLPVDVFDPAMNVWSEPATSGTFLARSGHASGVIDGKIYVVGGWTGKSERSDVQVFDPADNSWSSPTVSGDFTGRDGAGYCMLYDSLYVIDGSNAANTPLAVAEVLSATNGALVISPKNETTLDIVPNPASTTIQTPFTHLSPSVVDNLGRAYECPRTGNTLDISRLPPGVYYMSDGSSRARFVKE